MVDPNSRETKAKLAWAKLEGVTTGVGTCASQGYSFQVTDLPVKLPAGQTFWEKPALEVRHPGPYYQVIGGYTCIESTNVTELYLEVDAAHNVKVTPGTCASQGFTKPISALNKTVEGMTFKGFGKAQALILLI